MNKVLIIDDDKELCALIKRSVFETDEYQLTARRLARAAKVSANHLIMHDLSEMEYVHIKQQLPMLKQKTLSL